MDTYMARDLLLQHEKTIQALAITNLQMKGSMLKDQLNLIQDTIKLDSRRWEIKHGTIYEEEISNIIIQNEPDKTRNLAYVVNDQLHDIRNVINTGDKNLKKKDRVVEMLTHH
jgi:gas vesicle protein